MNSFSNRTIRRKPKSRRMRQRLEHWPADPCAVFADLRRALPEHFPLPPAPFHLDHLAWWQSVSRRVRTVSRRVYPGGGDVWEANPFADKPVGWVESARPTTPTSRQLNLIAPRGYAKSTLVSLAIPLLACTARHTRYIVLTSATASQAAQHLASLAAALESAADAWRFPALFASTRSKTRLVTDGGVRIDALGAQEQLRGRRHHARRPDLIIADDVETEDCQFSPLLREQTHNWFTGAVLSAGHPRTCFIVASTPLHSTSLCFQLAASDQWFTVHHSALAAEPDEDLWTQWQQQYQRDPDTARSCLVGWVESSRPTAAGHSAQFTPLWPDLEDTLALWEHRLLIGPLAFAREKMCRPKSGAHPDFNPAYFTRPLAPAMPPHTNPRVVGVDPAIAGTAARDWTAVALVGLDNHIIYADIRLYRCPLDESFDLIARDVIAFSPHAVFVESNGFQQLFATELNRRLDASRRVYPGGGPLDVPVIPIPQSAPKRQRIAALDPLFAQNRLTLVQNQHAQNVLHQFQEFPFADHDDAPDALTLALTGLATHLHQQPYERWSTLDFVRYIP